MPDRPLLGAHVTGHAAAVLEALVDEALPPRLAVLQHEVDAGRVDPVWLADLRSTVAAIHAAADQWRLSQASVGGRLRPAGPEAAGSSWEISTDAAADLLFVTPSRARQLLRSGRIAGRRVGRGWLADRASVLAYREGTSGGGSAARAAAGAG